MESGPWIALIGTLDTKGAEIAYVRDRLRALGARPLVVDSGILGEADGIEPDVSRAEVARAAGRRAEADRLPQRIRPPRLRAVRRRGRRDGDALGDRHPRPQRDRARDL